MSVVVIPSARERFTPHELTAAYENFTKRGQKYLDAETGLGVAAYRFGARVLIVYEEPETSVVVLSTNLGNRFSPRFGSTSGKFP